MGTNVSSQNGLSQQATDAVLSNANSMSKTAMDGLKQANSDMKDMYGKTLDALDKKDQKIADMQAQSDKKFNAFVETTMGTVNRMAFSMNEAMTGMSRMMASQTESMFRFQGQQMARL